MRYPVILAALLLINIAAVNTRVVLAQTPPATRLGSGSHSLPRSPAGQALADRANELSRLAELAIDAGDYEKAESDARQSISLGDFGLPNELLAQAFYLQGNDKEALLAYKSLSDFGEVFPRTLLPYANLLLKNGQYVDAARAYNKGIKLLGFGEVIRANGDFDIGSPQPKALAAAIHVAMGADYNGRPSWGQHSQDDKALAEYKAALDLQPESALANYYYGFGLQKLNKLKEARAAYIQAASLDSGDVYTAARAALKKLP